MVEPNKAIQRNHIPNLQRALDELAEYRPVQYVIGYEYFAGHKIKVNENVLIPRPETEEIFRMITADFTQYKYQDLNILDACTGSGVLACSLAAWFPRSKVHGCDISAEALEVAKTQDILHTPHFFQWDLLEDPPEIEELDIIVSNPPYVLEGEKPYMSRNVLDYEPALALFVPDHDPLRFYKALGQWASSLLKMGGRGYFEINEAFGNEITELFTSLGFSDVILHEDINSKPRFVSFTKWF